MGLMEIVISLVGIGLTSLSKKTGVQGIYIAAGISIVLGIAWYYAQMRWSTEQFGSMKDEVLQVAGMMNIIYNLFVKNGLVGTAVTKMKKVSE